MSSAISGLLQFLHYLLSLSYCVDCIIPYTNYYLPLGALAAAGLTEEILRLTGERRLAYVALGGLLVVAAMLQAFPSFPTLLRPRTGMVRMAATELAAQLRPNLPATGRILVLCDSVEAAQAVWLAGGVVEPRSMYLPSTFRAPKPELSRKERDRINSIIWDAGLWSEDSMRNALTQGFSSTLLIERRQTYGDVLGRTVRDGIPFGDVVAMHFRLAATSTVADRTFELYRRRE